MHPDAIVYVDKIEISPGPEQSFVHLQNFKTKNL